MHLYRDHVLPFLLHTTMRQEMFVPYRQRLIADVRGRTLEVGIGSGANLRFYDTRVSRLIGLEPSTALLSVARRAERRVAHVTLLEGSGECIPLKDGSIDTVVVAWTLCSIPDVSRALSEIRRVLTADGRLLFVEHGRAPDASVARWQDRLTPVWKRLAGGCHLNRPVPHLLESAGFRIERLHTGYMAGPRPMTFMFEGAARRDSAPA